MIRTALRLISMLMVVWTLAGAFTSRFWVHEIKCGGVVASTWLDGCDVDWGASPGANHAFFFSVPYYPDAQFTRYCPEFVMQHAKGRVFVPWWLLVVSWVTLTALVFRWTRRVTKLAFPVHVHASDGTGVDAGTAILRPVVAAGGDA
jgi:hypothetical protein